LFAVKQPLLGSPVDRRLEEEDLSKSRKVRLCGCSQHTCHFRREWKIPNRSGPKMLSVCI